jgi:hypothetical protein
MKEKSSVLRAIIDKVYVAKTFEEGMAVVKEHLENPECHIRPAEGRVIVIKANMCQSLPKLQQYLTNSFLKFEGLGL